MSLSQEDQSAVRALFVRGTEGLLEQGWSLEQITAFLSRPEIKAQVKALVYSYNSQEEILDRVRYYALMSLGQMAPQAIDVVRRGIGMSGANGELAPFPDEVKTAMDILDRLNVDARKDGKIARRDLDPDHILQKPAILPETIDYDKEVAGNEDMEALSRERVRNVINRFIAQGTGQSLIEKFHKSYTKASNTEKKKTKTRKKTTKKSPKKKKKVTKKKVTKKK